MVMERTDKDAETGLKDYLESAADDSTVQEAATMLTAKED